MSNADILAEAKRLKADAKRHRDIDDTAGALDAMDRAIEILQKAGEPESVRAELADSWGMKGGILRRAGRLPEALDAYKKGLEYESGDSYNLTNSVVLRLLINPLQFHQSRAQIEDARAEVDRQRPVRSSQWWFWADLGLLELLSGQEDRALDAYRHFSGTGARASDYESTISVLEELSDKFAGSNLGASLKGAIAFLQRLKP